MDYESITASPLTILVVVVVIDARVRVLADALPDASMLIMMLVSCRESRVQAKLINEDTVSGKYLVVKKV